VAPDFVEPVVGWRSWAVVQHRRELRLRSVVFTTVWLPQRELVGGCNRFWMKVPLPRPWRRAMAHDVPADPCACGIYATSDVETAANYLYLYDELRQPHLRYRAIGRVSLWGSVVESERGWRASYAYPERIFLPRTDRLGRPADVESICDGLAGYGVPVEIVEDDAKTALARAVRRVQRRRRRRPPHPHGVSVRHPS
jgi:hypothetical protein